MAADGALKDRRSTHDHDVLWSLVMLVPINYLGPIHRRQISIYYVDPLQLASQKIELALMLLGLFTRLERGLTLPERGHFGPIKTCTCLKVAVDSCQDLRPQKVDLPERRLGFIEDFLLFCVDARDLARDV